MPQSDGNSHRRRTLATLQLESLSGAKYLRTQLQIRDVGKPFCVRSYSSFVYAVSCSLISMNMILLYSKRIESFKKNEYPRGSISGLGKHFC